MLTFPVESQFGLFLKLFQNIFGGKSMVTINRAIAFKETIFIFIILDYP